MRNFALLLIAVFTAHFLYAGNSNDTNIVRPALSALRIYSPLKIDGNLDDSLWQKADVAHNFFQYDPVQGAKPSFPTEVRVLYDNTAIYIGAMCYDDHPDSIKKQLGLRDDYLNADNFIARFDTYNTQQDAFTFSVSASGVQGDSRISDPNFNAVWKSEVTILPNGWSVEMEIPWSALRFPTSAQQSWGLQFGRNIQRKFEYDQWAFTPKGKPNSEKYWGILTGLNDIKEPVRLSFTPYLTAIYEKDNRFGPDQPSTSFGGGMDLKYGINESFTLDMTLLPDFSQVRSDNIIKNLSPFEIQYNDQRPFFTEGTDLFQLGNIFYSRRIGKTPTLFYDAPSLTDSSEKIIKNPTTSRLLNATKITGRTNSGLGIGILNAFVDNTYAIAQDTITGKTRKILTEPRSNYNIVVFDKQLSNSSDVFFTNTNVIRTNGFNSANVTAAGFNLLNKKDSWKISGNGAVSNVLTPVDTSKSNFSSKLGYQYYLIGGKVSGKFQYGLTEDVIGKSFDANDMGFTTETNYATSGAYWNYSLYDPWKKLLNANVSLSASYSYNLETKLMTNFDLNFDAFATFRNFWGVYLGGNANPVDSRDYFEPRTEGRYFLRTRNYVLWTGFNSNTNKIFSYGSNIDFGSTARVTATIPPNPFGDASVFAAWRVGNRFSLSASTAFHGDYGDRGWVDTEDDGTIVFGRRIIRNWSNTITANFVFKRDMSVSINARHYWATGHYTGYYVLNDNGTLTDYVNYGGSADYSFNSFNVDVVYNWIFAPGSTLSIAWKQNMLGQSSVIDYDYLHNLHNTVTGPQLNQLSVRLLFYIDYNYLKRAVKGE